MTSHHGLFTTNTTDLTKKPHNHMSADLVCIFTRSVDFNLYIVSFVASIFPTAATPTYVVSCQTNKSPYAMAVIAILAKSLLFILTLFAIFPSATATGMEPGDVLALILGLIIGVMGFCACVGCYARKKSGVQ